MPTKSLIDFETTDLSQVVFDRDEVQRFCKQRGRFAMLDGVLVYDENTSLIVGYKDITLDDWWAADHIPGRPIFPGALQCEGAAQLASFDFLKRRPELFGQFLGFAGLDEVRFRGIVQPPNRLLFVARAIKLRPPMFVYETQGFVERELVFEGRILGIIL